MKLIRDTSTPEKRAWWDAVLAAAADAPTLTYEPENAPRPVGEGCRCIACMGEAAASLMLRGCP